VFWNVNSVASYSLFNIPSLAFYGSVYIFLQGHIMAYTTVQIRYVFRKYHGSHPNHKPAKNKNQVMRKKKILF